jgi:sterol 3beta-glucosyltransferase
MRIGLQTWGSEGDIRPFMALGHGLATRGHDVELVYTDFEDRQFEALAERLGFRARPVAMPVVADVEELTRIGLEIASASNPLTQGKVIFDRLFTPISDQLYDAATDLCNRCDLLVRHLVLYQLHAAATLAGRTVASVSFTHNLVPSRTLTPTGLPDLGSWGNVLGWKLARVALNRVMLPDINRFRERVGLPRFRDVMLEAWPSPHLNLITVSQTLCQPPPDWPPHHRVTGFLEVRSEPEGLPHEVHAFLNEGTAPAFMGFGSLMPRAREKLDETVAILRSAARRAGMRAIIHVPPESHIPLGRDDDVLVVGRVSHASLFPKCAVIVHHGGAGTTHTVLKAGVPSIVVPHVADQFFWAGELRRLGVALLPIARRTLTAEALGDRIRSTIGDARLRQRAQELAPRLRAENGVERAADLIEGLASRTS